MRILLTDALTEPLEIESIDAFFKQYVTWDYWEKKLPYRKLCRQGSAGYFSLYHCQQADS